MPYHQVIKLFFCGWLWLLSSYTYGQDVPLIRSLSWKTTADTFKLDSLTILPSSVKIKEYPKFDSLIFFDYIHGTAKILDPKLIGKTLTISYRTLPYQLSKKSFHKEAPSVKFYGKRNAYTLNALSEEERKDLFGYSSLQRSGAISRGVSFGNNQDLVLNSFIDVQLSGKLTPEIEILASLNDRNIPIQPEGTTASLQNFDQKFIQLNSIYGHRVTLGDVPIQSDNETYFMRFNKKSQGISAYTPLGKSEIIDSGGAGFHAGLSRGKWFRHNFNGVDGNQGPYRVKGAHGELFVVIIAGTEKVYRNGKLLTRGEQADYVINYNTGEVTFMPNILINRYDRIIIEYQYADRNYQRFIFHQYNVLKISDWDVRLQLFRESDNKNVPLFGDLTPLDRQILVNAGDRTDLATRSTASEVDFSKEVILYKKIDSVGYSYFKFSTDKDSARYQVSFTYLGPGKGNYKQISSLANGKIYGYVAPFNGQLSGDYEPVTVLVAAEQNSMVTAKALNQDFLGGKTMIEVALSQKDKNKFSKIDDGDNQALALKFNKEYQVWKDTNSVKNRKMVIGADYEIKQSKFSEIERFRGSEFARTWDKTLSNPQDNLVNPQEQIISAYQNFSKNGLLFLNNQLTYYNKGNFERYYQSKNDFKADNTLFHFEANADAVYGELLSFDQQKVNQSGRTKLQLKKYDIQPYIGLQTEGATGVSKSNKIKASGSDFNYHQYQAGFISKDGKKIKYDVQYLHREDYLPSLNSNKLIKSSIADEIGGEVSLPSKDENPWKVISKYRKWRALTDQNNPLLEDEIPTFLSRVEGGGSILGDAIATNLFYEINSGKEPRRDYIYIQVAKGQGTHTWIDYNNDSLKQFNEFERAVFIDQAEYVKTIIPSNEYSPSYGMNYQQSIKVRFDKIGTEGSFINNITSNLQYNGNFRASKKLLNQSDFKNYGDTLIKGINPFVNAKGDNLIYEQTSFRHTMFINRTNPVWGGDVNYSTYLNKSFLVSGFDATDRKEYQYNIRINPTYKINIEPIIIHGNKTYTSDYFPQKNYVIKYNKPGGNLSYQPTPSLRFTISYFHDSQKDTILSNETMKKNDLGFEIRFNKVKAGLISAKLNYIFIKYSSSDNNENINTPVAFEMLQGLKNGTNYTWNVNWNQKLQGNFQIALSYDGRQSEGSKAVHIGRANVTMFF